MNCDPRNPLVYQRDVDVDAGIYWINTQTPFARKIRESVAYGPNSTRWREYMFQRYIDIVVRQAVRELEKRDTGLTADLLDWELDRLAKKVYDAAASDPSLDSFLFHETMNSSPADGGESGTAPTEESKTNP